MSKLSLDFIPMETLNNISVDKRVETILNKIKEKKIIILNSFFDPEDEALLIQKTMKNINKSFPGIEICSLSSSELNKDEGFITKVKQSLINFLSGGKSGITVIGPAKIIKQIKREPGRISLLTK